MIRYFILFELKYNLKRPATYIYSVIMFLIAFWLVYFLGSDFDGQMLFFENDGQTKVNSSYTIYRIISYMSFFGILIIAPDILREFLN